MIDLRQFHHAVEQCDLVLIRQFGTDDLDEILMDVVWGDGRANPVEPRLRHVISLRLAILPCAGGDGDVGA